LHRRQEIGDTHLSIVFMAASAWNSVFAPEGFCRRLCRNFTPAVLLALTTWTARPQADPVPATTEQVGRRETNRIVTPVNQMLTPYGAQVELPGMRPQTLALSPNGRLLVTSGRAMKSSSLTR